MGTATNSPLGKQMLSSLFLRLSLRPFPVLVSCFPCYSRNCGVVALAFEALSQALKRAGLSDGLRPSLRMNPLGHPDADSPF